MHKWGNEKDERNTQKRGCWALGSVCVQSAHLPVSVCVASWLVVCEWECYWEIFLILCVSSSHLPQQETSEGSWKTFPTQLSFKYTHTQIHTPWHTVSEVFHMAPVASLKVKKRELARLLKVFFFFLWISQWELVREFYMNTNAILNGDNSTWIPIKSTTKRHLKLKIIVLHLWISCTLGCFKSTSVANYYDARIMTSLSVDQLLSN